MTDQPDKNLAPMARAAGHPILQVARRAYSANSARLAEGVGAPERMNPGEHTNVTVHERYKTWSGKAA